MNIIRSFYFQDFFGKELQGIIPIIFFSFQSDRNYGHGHAEPMAALIRGELPKKEEPSGEEGGEETPNAANGTKKMDVEDGTALSQSKKKKESNEHKKRSRSRSR